MDETNYKKPNSMFDELSTKYKKDNAHTKNIQNKNVWKVKLELQVFPRHADVSVVGQCRESKQPKSSSKAKLCSWDQREKKFYTTTLFPPFRYSMPKPWGPSPMMFHHYAPWFGWCAPPMQYESFYPRLAKHEPNAFDRSAHPRKDRFYLKSQLNAGKTQEQPNRTFRFRNPEVPVF
jgi:hypothetical protein